MEIPILKDIIVILGFSLVISLVFNRIKLPAILGFLITGAIAGPHGLSLVHAEEEVEILAEIGVILLLFVIGMEFSLKSLAKIKNSVLLGGTLQVGLTIVVVTALALFFDFAIANALFIGFLFSLSSTAIVLKLLQERGEITSPHGSFSLAVLIFQDIIVVPMMLFTPILAGQSDNPWEELMWMLLKVGGVLIVVLYGARYLIPWLLYQVVRTRSTELFILSIIVICFSVAYLTSLLGLSLALGAFMAGLIISESDYSHQATGNILPFREIFISFFFVSIGMLLQLEFLRDHWWLILILTVSTLFLKSITALLAAKALKLPLRSSLIGGIALFQVGEFAFILSRTGIEFNILAESTYQYFLSISILTMAVTPLIFPHADRIALAISKMFSSGGARNAAVKDPLLAGLDDHLVIIGYGVNGKNVATAAKSADIPYLVIELNAETVKKEKARGERIYFGDAVHPSVLEHVNIGKARVAVIAISDPDATKRIVRAIRQFSDSLHLIVRTRFVAEVRELLKMGANEVIPEEFETSIEIFTHVLNQYLVPRDKVEQFVAQIRADSYQALRPFAERISSTLPTMRIPELQFATLTVQREDKRIIGVRLKDAELRKNLGITVAAINRDGDYIRRVDGETVLQKGDTLYVFGSQDEIDEFNALIRD